MRIRVTEIDTTAEELRNSNTLSDSFGNILRNIFNSIGTDNAYVENEEDEEDEE